MMDGVVITNEVIQEAKEKKKPCFILKVSKKLMIMWDGLFFLLHVR